ncbi:glycosyltransferase family 39 protein [Oscillatoria sp. CS-180]|nr:glycosyltransferase family 39 protein [Oscillatoria sp. CS-180]
MLWLFILIGVLLRVVQYALDTSLWIDEAFLALNILERSPAELLDPLSYRQGAPYGFLVLTKGATLLLGTDEWVLRLLPFLSGIASLLLFQKLARELLSLQAAAIAVGFFALSDRLIYYSAELKQYSSDVAIALLVYVLLVSWRKRKATWLEILTASIIGAVLIWFSHPVIFVLAGLGLAYAVPIIYEKRWRQVSKVFVLLASWSVSFLCFYWISLRSLTQNEALQQSFTQRHNAFMPLPPTSFGDIRWFFENFFDFFDDPVGLPLVGLAAFFFAAGLYQFWRVDKTKLTILVSPLLITLLASGLHQYPFKARLLLFLAPIVLLTVAAGVCSTKDWIKAEYRWIEAILVLIIFLHPVYYAANNLVNPNFITNVSSRQRVREHIKPVLSYINKNRQSGDKLHIYYAAQYAFKYYTDKFEFSDLMTGTPVVLEPSDNWFEPALSSYPPQLVVGQYSRDNISIFLSELEQLKGSDRVWFLFSHAHDRRSKIDEEELFLSYIQQSGTQIDAFSDIEASVYLYDLRS